MTKALFDVIRDIKFRAGGGMGLTQAEVDAVNGALGVSVPEPAASARQINNAGLSIVKEFEGLRLTAYPDPATNGDPWTIGWGHTGPDVHKGLTITESKAAQLLFKDLKRFEAAVAKLAPVATDNQFSAMVSLAFNVGEGNLGKSTLLRKHNAGDYTGAKAEFARWNRAAGKVMSGLTRRRAAEADLYGR